MIENIEMLEEVRDDLADMYESLNECSELRLSEYATRNHQRRLYTNFSKVKKILDNLSQL